MSAIQDLATEVTTLKAQVADFSSRLAEAEAAAGAMREALQDGLSPGDSGWWCPTCKYEVPDVEVTFEDCHDVCGTYIGTVNTNEWRRCVHVALSSDAGRSTLERIRELEEENTSLHAHITHLEAEVDRHRERANEAQTAWENHQATDCAIKCCREIEEIIGTSDPVEAVKILRNWRKRLGDD